MFIKPIDADTIYMSIYWRECWYPIIWIQKKSRSSRKKY